MGRKLFGTDGMRGRAGEYPLQPQLLYSMGQSLVKSGLQRILIGRDTRASGPWIERTLAAGIAAARGTPVTVGVITTPGVSLLCRSGEFDGGIMISASHNPYRDNGVKIFGADGIKLSDAEEIRLEQRIEAETSTLPSQLEAAASSPAPVADFDRGRVQEYVNFLIGTWGDGSLRGIKVALDCANGAAYAVAEEVFQRLGAEVVAVGNRPDGANINARCGALHPATLSALVTEQQADVGLAFDGDADRLILVDEQGTVRDGDYVLYILGTSLAREARLPTGTVVTTVMANLGLELALGREGLALERTQVGDRHVLAAMLQGGHELGGEQSGHTIIRSCSVSGDGILTGIQVLKVMTRTRQPLSRLCRGMQKLPQVLLNVDVRDQEDYSQIPAIQDKISAAEKSLGDRGRVLIRYSGTEPVARIMVEGPRQELVETLAGSVASAFEAELGARRAEE